MRSVEDEAKICLPNFTRLCIASVVATGARLDQTAVTVARELHSRIPKHMGTDLVRHFEETLSLLVDLVSALSPRLPPQLLRDFSEKTSQAQVCASLLRSISDALRKSQNTDQSKSAV